MTNMDLYCNVNSAIRPLASDEQIFIQESE